MHALFALTLAAAAAVPARSGPAAVTDVVDVAVGSGISAHAGCLLRASGQVACWGGPNILHEMEGRESEPLPGPWEVEGINSAVKVVQGAEQACALLRDHTVRCWNGKGSVYDAGVTDVVELGLGSDHACARTSNGHIRCWGDSLNGTLGVVETESVPGTRPAREVPGIAGATQLSVAGYGACVITSSAAVACWGATPFQEAWPKVGAGAPFTTLRRYPALQGAKRIELGGVSCAFFGKKGATCVRQDGTASKPIVKKLANASLGNALAYSSGGETATFIAPNGTVWEWGPGPGPYLRDASWQAKLAKAWAAPRQVPGIANAIAVSSTATHACAVTKAGALRCWGENKYGALADGTVKDSWTAPTTAIWFEPDLLPVPTAGAFGCTADTDLRRSCRKAGEGCRLESPPGYWTWGGNKGTRVTEEEENAMQEELGRRPLPGCMCSCSPEYEKAEGAWNRARQNDLPRP